MRPAYINAVKQHLPNAKIAFERFHIARHLGDAVNAVRKDGHRELLSQGDATLAKTKFVWLQKPNRMKRGRRMLLKAIDLLNTALRVRLGVERDGVKVVELNRRHVEHSRHNEISYGTCTCPTGSVRWVSFRPKYLISCVGHP